MSNLQLKFSIFGWKLDMSDFFSLQPNFSIFSYKVDMGAM
jgi:hypothetical protein